MPQKSEESLRAKLARAEALALKKKEQAQALNEQIESVERAIQQLELKVSASVGLPLSEGEVEDGIYRSVKFGRDGKTWRLLLVTGAHGEEPEENALVNAALRSKLEAIEALPSLLDRLLEKAEEQVHELNEHIDAAAKFAAELRKGR